MNWINEYIKMQTEKAATVTVRLLLFGAVLYFVAMSIGCSQSGGGGASAEARVADPNLVVAPTPTPTPVNPTIPLTYYKLARTEAPMGAWPTKTYTSNASCVVYLTKTYCWDDGVKILQWSSGGTDYGPYRYTYWGRTANNSACHGGCTDDLMPQPRFISATLQTTLTLAAINQVFSSGVSKAVTCAETSGQLNCADFIVDLNQTPL